MDPRIREHAEVLVEHSARIESGDNVSIQAPPLAEDLVVALHKLLGERGANPSVIMRSNRATRAFVQSSDTEDFECPAHSMAAAEEADVTIHINGAENINETSDLDPEKFAAYGATMNPIQERALEDRWVGTQFPAPGNAQDAEMSTEAYEEFVYNAVLKE